MIGLKITIINITIKENFENKILSNADRIFITGFKTAGYQSS